MCDLTEIIYSPDDVVWVKLGPVWWPGRVCGENEIPPEIMKDLRKKPIAIVKFFQEDSFEYVKSLSNIYHYHCPRKNEFIKKGLDLLRSKNPSAPSNMKLFPEDIVRAEHLTHGNTAILQSDTFLPEEKPVYTDLFTSKKTPKKVKSEVKKKQIPVKQTTPRLITHPRFLQLSSGQSTDYEARERKQIPMRAECDIDDSSPLPLYSCTECDYTTTRLNVIVWHNKSHTRNYTSPQVSKPTKRKSTVSMKLAERSSSSPSEPKADEGPSAAKIPKTNGTMTVTPTPRKRGRPKGSFKKTPAKTPETPKTNSTRTPTEKRRRSSGQKGDEIHKSLLEDWLEDDMDQEDPATDENSSADVDGENKTLANSATSNDSKSCFDFDDSEDHLAIDETKFKPGRKIPRLLKKRASDDVSKQDSVEVDTAVDSTPQFQSGVDGVDGESSLSRRQTSRLQEAGVDNEIEINTEEVHVDEVTKSVPPKKSRRNLKTEKKADDAAELHNKVDKLLNEISTPAKLPNIPRSHKKAQLKAYQQQAAAEELAAQKVAAEAEAARVAAAEAEAAEKAAAAEAEAAQQAAAEAQAAKKAAAKAEAAQKAAAEAEAAQKAAAEAEAAQKAEAEAAQKAAAEAKAAQIALEKEAAAQQNAEAKEACNLYPETVDIEVSSIPLPSSRKSPVTSDPFESSISIGASVTVDEGKTDEQSIVSPSKVSGETSFVENVVTDASGPTADQKTPVATSSASSQMVASVASAAKMGSAPTTDKTSVKFVIPSQNKAVNAGSLLRSGQQVVKYISKTKYEELLSKLNASAGQGSPSKSSAQPPNTIRTAILGNQSSSTPKKFLILTSPSKKASPTPPSTTPAAGAAARTAVTLARRSINLSNAPTLRVAPNILQKSAAAQKAVAALAKTSGKNIVLDATTFQSLFQTSPQQLCKMQSQIAAATAKPQASSATAPSQPVVYVDGASVADSNGDCASTVVSSSTAPTVEYIVDSSGNLVQVDETPATPKDDILAKALENTDGLQTEMALSQVATMDVHSVTQNPEVAYKTEVVYENVSVNTAPIMSAYETPSRAVASPNVPAEAMEMALMGGAAESDSNV